MKKFDTTIGLIALLSALFVSHSLQPVLANQPIQASSPDQQSIATLNRVGSTTLPIVRGETSQQAAADAAADIANMDQAGKLNTAAKAALNDQQYVTAEANAQEALALEPSSALGQKYLAAALYLQGKDQEALQAYQVIAKDGFNDMADALPYTLLLLKAGRWPEAVAAYNKSLTLGGDVGVLRANSHFSADVPQPAAMEAALHVALGIDSGWSGYHGTASQCQDQQLAQFQKALAIEPGNPLLHYYYGYGLYQTCHKKQAQVEFQKAAATGDENIKAVANEALKF